MYFTYPCITLIICNEPSLHPMLSKIHSISRQEGLQCRSWCGYLSTEYFCFHLTEVDWQSTLYLAPPANRSAFCRYRSSRALSVALQGLSSVLNSVFPIFSEIIQAISAGAHMLHVCLSSSSVTTHIDYFETETKLRVLLLSSVFETREHSYLH